MFPTAYAQSQILDSLCSHGVYVDNIDLTPLNPTDDTHTEPYNVLRTSTHAEDGSLFLPYHFTAYGLEIQELHWSHSQKVTGSYKVFPLNDHSDFTAIARMVLEHIVDNGQQFE